jgi:hypothetical protein
MKMKSLSVQTLAGGLLFLSGCDVVHNAQSDLDRITSSNPFSPQPSRATTAPARPAAPAVASAKPSSPSADLALKQPVKADPTGEKVPPSTVNFIGKSESQLRDLLGPPTTVEERPPGKVWRYREGQCTLDVQLYPDVQTRQFGTLAYEVKSDDNTDEGNRACLVQLRSRAQSHG